MASRRPYNSREAHLVGGRFLNYIHDTADDFNQRYSRRQFPSRTLGAPTGVRVGIKNTSGGTLERGQCVALGSPVVLPTADEEEWWSRRSYASAAVSASNLKYIGIINAAVSDGETVMNAITIQGIAAAIVEVTDAGHDWCKPVAGEIHLQSAESGPIPILWKESGTGLKKAEVRLGSAQQAEGPKIGKTDAAVSPGGTVTVSIWRRISGTLTDTGEDIEDVVYDWIDAEEIAEDAEVKIDYYADEDVWRISDAECPE